MAKSGVRGYSMARPRDPSRIKVIKGTFRPDRAPANEPDPLVITSVPRAPSHLNRWAKQMWNATARELVRLRMFTTLDTYSLEVLCEQYGIYRELKESITHKKVEGKLQKITLAEYLATRNSQTMPEFTAMKGAFERYSALLKEFGLSPSSRSRIDLLGEPPATKDPMEDLLKSK
jgi:P27 family predicted phage terminase small subunit